MPDYLSFEEAATLPCAGVTAWSALSGIQAGDFVLTQGSGGVSLFSLQLARLHGARVIATTTDKNKADRLKQLGADEVIDVATHSDWAMKAKEITQGRGVDRIVEVGGPGTLQQSIQAVAYHGQVSLIGALSAGQGNQPIDFSQLFQSQARYECIGVGSRSDLEDLMRAMKSHALRPTIDSIYHFDQFDKALEYFSGRSLFGKVVITHTGL
jgi:NADPH:quinone reductase-like Zn-dependent oxidoreductase